MGRGGIAARRPLCETAWSHPNGDRRADECSGSPRRYGTRGRFEQAAGRVWAANRSRRPVRTGRREHNRCQWRTLPDRPTHRAELGRAGCPRKDGRDGWLPIIFGFWGLDDVLRTAWFKHSLCQPVERRRCAASGGNWSDRGNKGTPGTGGEPGEGGNCPPCRILMAVWAGITPATTGWRRVAGRPGSRLWR